jgi:transketolase
MPRDDLPAKWNAFGWKTIIINGHSEAEIQSVLSSVNFKLLGTPTAVIARTTKGKGAPMLEGHGIWHHRIPNDDEYRIIMASLL